MAETSVSGGWRGARYSFESPELVAPGPEDGGASSPTQQEPAFPLPDGTQVNALTVLTLLEKLASMLESVQQRQARMGLWQTGLGNSVKKVQGDLGRLAKEHTDTSNMVSKLMGRSLHLSANMKEARHYSALRSGQVQRLHDNHLRIMNRTPIKVLLFQEEAEIPPSVFVKEPEPEPPSENAEEQGEKGETSDEKTKSDEIWHTVDLSSDEELARAEECMEDSGDERAGESRTKKLKRTSLLKVNSMKKAFTLHNIEKTMNRLVPPEKREKFKKSLSPSLRKKSVASTASKGEEPAAIPEGADSAPQEEKPAELPAASDPLKTQEAPTSITQEVPETAAPVEKEEPEKEAPEKEKPKITITVDNTRISMGDYNAERVPDEEIPLDSE